MDGNCADNYKIERTWKATDRCGNTSTTCKQTITIEDTTPPVVTCPSNITIECSDDFTPNGAGYATSTDNCDPDPTETYTDVTVDGNCADNYKIERTWKATDRCGNTSTTCKQTITIEDTTPPVVTCPSGITIECSDDFTPDGAGYATSTDNCDPDPTETFTDAIVDGNCPDNYSIERTWKATDRCGNTSTTCKQIITIEDTTPPVFDNKPVDITVECDAVPTPETVTAHDNCDLDVEVTFNQVRTDGPCPDTYVLTRTWIAIDNCENATTHSQKVTVQDTTPPEFDNKPVDLTVECDVVPVPEVVTAHDNCDLDVQVTFNEIRTDGSCPDSYTLTRTWIAIDNCDNATTHTQKITVEDTTPPVFDNKPVDLTVECDAVPVAEVVTAHDNCDLDVQVTFNEIRTDGTCPDAYTLTRTWIAIDNCDNATTHTQKVTVEDTTPPVFDNKPTDITVECDAVPVAEVVTAHDNCDLDVEVTYNEVKTDGSCPDSYTLTRTWIALDNCGNATTHVQKVTVEDTTPPVFDNKPVDLTVECDAVPVAEVVTAHDNCDLDVQVTFNEIRTDGTCPDAYTLTRVPGSPLIIAIMLQPIPTRLR